MKQHVGSIDDYIQSFPPNVQALLELMRRAIRKAAPEAEETISYNIPAFRQNGILVYFAAFKNHIGFYPTSSGKKAFEKELGSFKGGRGSVRFPYNKPIPFDLIERIVKYRLEENLRKRK